MDVIDKIIEDNKELIDLQQQKADLLPKVCEHCSRDLDGWQEAKGEKVLPNEYLAMMSIADDYAGGVGGITYTCSDCSEHMDKYHAPGMGCMWGKDCEIVASKQGKE